MSQEHPVFDTLESSGRIALTSPGYFNSLKKIVALSTLSILVIIVGIICLNGLNVNSIVLCSLIFLTGLICLRFLTKRVHASAIKGGTLIITNLSRKNYVTSLRSVNQVTTYHILGMQVTKLKFNLDGIERVSIIVNREGFLPFATDCVILKALELYKKQKANL